MAASGDGTLSIAVTRDGFSRETTLTSDARHLFVILEEGAADAAAPTEPKQEPKTGFLDRLRR